MKTLSLLMTAALAMPAAASSYKAGKTSGYKSGAVSSRALTRSARSLGGFGAQGPAYTGGFGTRTLAGPTQTTPAPTIPGWLANPQPGALIRTAGMGFKTSDPGPAHTTADYSAAGWGDTIAHLNAYAQYTTGIGVRQGPPDTPPYPGGRGGGGAGGNGIFTNGPVLGLDSSGQTVTTSGGDTTINGGIHGGNGNNGGHGGNASNGN